MGLICFVFCLPLLTFPWEREESYHKINLKFRPTVVGYRAQPHNRVYDYVSSLVFTTTHEETANSNHKIGQSQNRTKKSRDSVSTTSTSKKKKEKKIIATQPNVYMHACLGTYVYMYVNCTMDEAM